MVDLMQYFSRLLCFWC